MPLLHTERPAASKRPYALAPETYQVRDDGAGHEVDAVWIGRKNGKTTVSTGVLSLWWRDHTRSPSPPTLADCKEKADPRYGGECHARWDGTHLWVNPRHPLTHEEQAEVITTLDAALSAFPSPPHGYDGWYYLTD